MMFTGVLAYAAWQDGRRQHIGVLTVIVMLAASLGVRSTPAGAIVPLIAGVPWMWLHRVGSVGSAEPPAAVAIISRHGLTLGLVALGIACLITAVALLVASAAPAARGALNRPTVTERRRLPFYPGLLIAHLLIWGVGAA
ncbi:MAG: hypothetical protein ACOCYB_07410 [Alkalispirochaeta sp.]